MGTARRTSRHRRSQASRARTEESTAMPTDSHAEPPADRRPAGRAAPATRAATADRAGGVPSEVELFFDPVCPWTWATSRWLVEVAARRGIEVVWRSLSLAVLNAGKEIPPERRAA